MKRILGVALTLVMAASLAGAAAADDKKKPDDKKPQPKDYPLDVQFILKVSQCNNNAENCLVVFEKLTSSEKVREFAKEAKKDHDELQKAVATAIKNKKIAIVNTPDRESIAQINELRKKDK